MYTCYIFNIYKKGESTAAEASAKDIRNNQTVRHVRPSEADGGK